MNVKGDCVRNRRDLEAAAVLAADSFMERHPLLKRHFAQHVRRMPGVGLEHVRVVRHGGRIVALLVIYEKPVRLGRARMRMGGLGFVCSAEALRGKGLATACLSEAVRHMQSNGFHYSLLFGIDRFYTRVGYVGCLPWYGLRVPVNELSGVRSTLNARPFQASDGRAVIQLYDRSARDCVSSAERTEASLREGLRRWQLFPRRPESEDGLIVFHRKRERQEVRAYLIWRNGGVAEAGVTPGDEAASASVVAWVREKRRAAMEKEIVLPHGPGHPLTRFAMRFRHTSERSLSWTGGGMGRIIDANAFLDALKPELEARLNRAGMDGQCHLHLIVRAPDDKGRRTRAPGVTRHTLRLAAGHQFMLANRPQYWLKVECSAQALLQLSLGTLPHDALPGLCLEGERNLMPVLFPQMAPELFALDHF